MTKQQRRGRAIAMTEDEVTSFLAEERVCRVASISAGGRPHVSPLWFVWDGAALWLNSIVKSQRWTDLERDPRVSIVVDAGVEFFELRGVEISGDVEVIGDVPRTNVPDEILSDPERRFAMKYMGSPDYTPDGRHAWLRIIPTKIVSWDFRKSPMAPQ